MTESAHAPAPAAAGQAVARDLVAAAPLPPLAEPPSGAAAPRWLACLPSAAERRRIRRMAYRYRRQPWRDPRLPRAWRRQLRLAFWWHCALLCLREPRLMALALLAVPGWLLWWARH